MLDISQFIKNYSSIFPDLKDTLPWDITNDLSNILRKISPSLGDDFLIKDNIAIHKTAVIESGVTLKGPVIIGENCFIGANAYFREGVYLCSSVKIGPGCEIKSSIIFDHSTAAHFNYIGNSIIGSHVNFEAGSIAANHYNERTDKQISVLVNSAIIQTGVEKFGALVGDHSKIGANAILSPGTILKPNSIVKRLELVEQVK